MSEQELREDITLRIMPFVRGAVVGLLEHGHGEYCDQAEKDGLELIEYIINLILEKNNAGI